MKHNLFLTMMAAVLGSGVAEAAGTFYASDYTSGTIAVGSFGQHDELVVDAPLTLNHGSAPILSLFDNAVINFQKEETAQAICRIIVPEELSVKPNPNLEVVYFRNTDSVFNFKFSADAQALIVASDGTPITLIEDLRVESNGFNFSYTTPAQTTLKLNGAGYNQTVEMGGVQFTYVGPQDDNYTFQVGEIGFKGYYQGSHALILEHGGGIPVPEPTTGSLSLLALAGLCARRRRK